MRKWLERLAMVLVLLATVGVLLLCWMPAYVGVPDGVGEGRRHRPPRLGR